MTHVPGHTNDDEGERVKDLEDQDLGADGLKGERKLGEAMGEGQMREGAGGRPSEDGDADADLDEEDAGGPHQRSRDIERGEP
ncbi:MAG: hypothetical protein ACREGJ_03830 [Candidatus Saccharimonadales bacterium]